MRTLNFAPFARPVLIAGCLAFTGVGASCDKDRGPQRQQYIKDQITDLNNANVTKDVDAAVKKGDYRFVGVNDRGLMIPGVDDSDIKVIQARYGVRVIENTTDKPRTKQEEELQGVAWGYAAEYNKLLRRQLPSGR